MKSKRRHIVRSISTTIDIQGKPENIWDNITNIKLENFSDLWLFKVPGIPKPIKAEIISTGEGGLRIAYFNRGKRFMQRITTWKPFEEYSFDFNLEKGFVVGHFFDLSDGIFRVPNGSYMLTESGKLQLYNFQPLIAWIKACFSFSTCRSG